MNKTVSVITVMFDEPFWVGIYERQVGNRYEACKIIFGAEPKDYEVYEYLLKNYDSLKFSPAIETKVPIEKRINPKRMQRIVKKQVSNSYMGTKAQQALKLLHEQLKSQRKSESKQKREEEKIRQFEIKSTKRKEKHKGH